MEKKLQVQHDETVTHFEVDQSSLFEVELLMDAQQDAELKYGTERTEGR